MLRLVGMRHVLQHTSRIARMIVKTLVVGGFRDDRTCCRMLAPSFGT
jgi:hypothetical protein